MLRATTPATGSGLWGGLPGLTHVPSQTILRPGASLEACRYMTLSGLRREESGSDSLKGNSQTVRNALGSSVQYSPESNGKGSHSIGRKRTRT